MSLNLEFEIGYREDARGNALVYIPGTKENQTLIATTVNIDGAKLKEAISSEILEGRLILLDVFEPLYVAVTPLEENLPHEKLVELAKKDARDLIYCDISQNDHRELAEVGKESEVWIDPLIAQYTTIYRENVYLRAVRELDDEVFHLRKRVDVQFYYSGLFKMAYWICYGARARREQDLSGLAWAQKNIQNLHPHMPVLNISKVTQSLESGDGVDWEEMANYVDAFFLTLKKYYPFPLRSGIHLQVKKENLAWLSEGLPNIYEDYFLALLKEDYEKASGLMNLLKSHSNSQSLEECSS